MMAMDMPLLISDLQDLSEDLLVCKVLNLIYDGLGMSSAQLGISEIGVGYPDSTFGSESRIGIPFIVKYFILEFTHLVPFKRNPSIRSNIR
jgi:hypothetical protein